ncbi:hypothetical protein KM043_013780 [Ampulex compressa]|nr:hypothetical protein KM043_013780 [Ampulex compressa]
MRKAYCIAFPQQHASQQPPRSRDLRRVEDDESWSAGGSRSRARRCCEDHPDSLVQISVLVFPVRSLRTKRSPFSSFGLSSLSGRSSRTTLLRPESLR